MHKQALMILNCFAIPDRIVLTTNTDNTANAKQILFTLFVMLKRISNIVTVTLIENIVIREKALSLTFDKDL